MKLTRHTPDTAEPAGTWRDHALCATDPEPDCWFPIGTTGPALDQAAYAKAVCAECPVRTECLADALDNGLESGILGGLDEGERRPMHRARAQAAGVQPSRRGGTRPPARCGTRTAIRRHRRRGEQLDPECQAAYDAGEDRRQRAGRAP